MKTNDEFLRKRKMRQKRIRRRRLIISMFFLLIVGIVVTVILCLTVLFPIKTISVSGSKRYSEAQIVDMCGIETGDNLFTASQQKCEERLRVKLPYVEKITFRRELSGKLNIRVTDAAEYAVYTAGGKYYAASRAGHILNEYAELPQGLLEIRVPDLVPEVGRDLALPNAKTGDLLEHLIAQAKENGLTLDRIDLTDPVNITVKIGGRFLVNFGTENALENKFRHLAEMIEKIAPEKTGMINLNMWNPTKPEGTFVEKSIE